MPETTPYTSESGNKYVRERPIDEIIDNLLTPQDDEKSDENEEDPEDKDNDKDEQSPAQLSPKNPGESKQSALGKKASVGSKLDKKSEPDATPAAAADGDQENADEEDKKDEEPKFLANDYLEKAEMSPPKDPYGADTMHPDLLIIHAQLKEIIENSLLKALRWITVEKGNYSIKVQAEGKDL